MIDRKPGSASPECILDEKRSPAETMAASSPQPTDAGHGAVRKFGNYELLGEIARGGMGVVYRARQTKLDRIVALKMILAGRLAGPTDVKRFQSEARTAARLDHPGIVRVYDVGEHEGQHYFSMEHIDGFDLCALMSGQPLPIRESVGLVRQAAEAVAYAHRHGVIHRDLKPQNLLVDLTGQMHVTDFGLAKCLLANEHLTQSQQILGTPGFMSPEQASGQNAVVGPAADIYSLGAVLYFLLTGRPPFQSPDPLQTLRQVVESEPLRPRLLNRELPRELEAICLKCLAKDPARRYPSAQALADDLGRFLAGEPVQAKPPSSVLAVARLAKQHLPEFTLYVLAAALFCVVCWDALLVGVSALLLSSRSAVRPLLSTTIILLMLAIGSEAAYYRHTPAARNGSFGPSYPPWLAYVATKALLCGCAMGFTIKQRAWRFIGIAFVTATTALVVTWLPKAATTVAWTAAVMLPICVFSRDIIKRRQAIHPAAVAAVLVLAVLMLSACVLSDGLRLWRELTMWGASSLDVFALFLPKGVPKLIILLIALMIGTVSACLASSFNRSLTPTVAGGAIGALIFYYSAEVAWRHDYQWIPLWVSPLAPFAGTIVGATMAACRFPGGASFADKFVPLDQKKQAKRLTARGLAWCCALLLGQAALSFTVGYSTWMAGFKGLRALLCY